METLICGIVKAGKLEKEYKPYIFILSAKISTLDCKFALFLCFCHLYTAHHVLFFNLSVVIKQ